MARKIFAAVVSAVMLICMAGCSKNYVMTEEDLAVQKSIEGYWFADDSTGYNEYDENGNCLSLMVVEFTSDYKYLIHSYKPGNDQASGYVITFDPIAYSFKEKMFKVDADGVASYARVSVSEDGQIMYWITDDNTDKYNRLTKVQAAALGIPEYDPAVYTKTEASSEEGSVSESVSADVTESETGSVSENAEEGEPVFNSNVDVSADTDVSKLKFDRSIKFNNGDSDYDKTPVLLWESEDGEIAVFGRDLYLSEQNIFIEHDGVIDTFEQDWVTPRRIEPRFKYGDFDGDGTDELAAIYYVGSGTGVSVEELVFYELRDGHFKSYAYDPVGFLEGVVTADIDNEAHTVTFTLKTNGDSVSYDTAEDYPNGIGEIGWGSNIGYEFDGNDVILTAHPSINLSYECMPKITAKVAYDDEDDVEFGLGDITIDKEF